MGYIKYVNNKKFRIYEFEYFDLKDIEKNFNGKRIWRIGKFLSKFATNEKFIKLFNYVMSLLLISCIATFYY